MPDQITEFLKYYANIYRENPSLEITKDSIYHGLMQSRFISDGKMLLIPDDDLEYERYCIEKRYPDNAYSHGYFEVFENYGGLTMSEYREKIVNSIKLYVAIDKKNFLDVSTKIFDFMNQNDIINQSKISRKMRADALVLRIDGFQNAKEVTEYINSLEYNSLVYPNPFLFRQGKVAIAKDGNLSYNVTVATIMAAYFKNRRETDLENVSITDFTKYINEELALTYDIAREINIRTPEDVENFNLIKDLLKNNLLEKTTLEYFEEPKKKSPKNIKEDCDYKNLYYIIEGMIGFYGVEQTHRQIENYIQTGECAYFTRRLNIREIVMDNYSPERLAEDISEIGWIHLKEAYQATKEKYNSDQAAAAIIKLMNYDVYDGFTNDNNSRDKLKNFISLDRLKSTVQKRLENQEESKDIFGVIEMIETENAVATKNPNR